MLTSQERLRFHILGGMLVIDAALYALGPMQMRWAEVVQPLAVNAFLIAGIVYCRAKNLWPLLTTTLLALVQMALFVVLSIILNYVLLIFNRPLIDEALLQIDVALGFNWLELYALLKPGYLGVFLMLIYKSHGLLISGTIILLCLMRRERDLDVFLLAFFLATLGAMGFWAVFPSFGGLPHLVSQNLISAPLGTSLDYDYAKILHSIKDGVIQEIFFEGFMGLVGFPSCHAVFAVTVVYAVRSMRRVYPVVAVWSVLLLVSTPVEGGHHVVDVIGGSILSLVAIWVAIMIVDRKPSLASAAMPAAQPAF